MNIIVLREKPREFSRQSRNDLPPEKAPTIWRIRSGLVDRWQQDVRERRDVWNDDGRGRSYGWDDDMIMGAGVL